MKTDNILFPKFSFLSDLDGNSKRAPALEMRLLFYTNHGIAEKCNRLGQLKEKRVKWNGRSDLFLTLWQISVKSAPLKPCVTFAM